MNLILYELVIVCVIAGCCSQRLLPLHDGCTQLFHDTTNPDECTHITYCRGYVSSLPYDQIGQCHNFLYNVNGFRIIDPISVVLNYNDNAEFVPTLEDENNREIIYSLDISDNNEDFDIIPNFQHMPNLAILKMSRCSLVNAKLSNRNDLPALKDIDFSENNINNIQVVPGEHEYKTLEKLNISHNYLVNIPEAVFDSFPNIESLDLSHNYIYTLDIMSFEGLRKLLYLNLSYNRLAKINSSLLRFYNLITLDLSHNNIQVIKSSDFGKLVNLKTINLDSNEINTLEKNVFDNMASLTTIDLRNNYLESIDRDMFINITKLTTVYLSRNKLKTLPKNMFQGKVIFNFTIEGNELEGTLERGSFEGFAMVTELDISGQHLTSVENYAFAGLQNVKTLLLNNNDLESLSNYSFKGLHYLNCLDLSYNKLQKLDIATEDLTGLQILTLHHNKITFISSNNFIALGSLQLLDLSHNNISHLGSNSFRHLQSLLNFKISDNPLYGAIEEKTFDGLSSLPSLDISGTLITTVNNGSFMGMSLLKELNVSHSNISGLQYNSLSYASNIRTIDLSHNLLSVFDVNTTDLRNLKSIMLNNNMLQAISQTFFSGLSILSTVILSHNHINTIHKESFYALQDIRNLDLSYNPDLEFDVLLVEKSQNLENLFLSGTKAEVTFDKVSDLPLNKLEMAHSSIQNISQLKLYKMQRLETLVLSNNNVTKLEVGALSNLTSLRQLDLSNNNLYYIQPGAFKDNTYLKVLNISHNMIAEINYGIFRGLLYVEVIDLSYNKIKSLHRSRFYDIEHLNTLIVDNNEIDFISEDEFVGTGLSKLSIGGNPLPCEILVYIEKKSYEISITSISNDLTKENVNGVTCNRGGFNHLKPTSTPVEHEHEKLLLDIRNILYNVSQEQTFKGHGDVINRESSLTSLTKQQLDLVNLNNNTNLLLQKLNQNSINLTSALVNANSNTNLLLGRLLRVLTSKDFKSKTTIEPISTDKENATSDHLVPYIDKIKQNLEETIAVEKQNVLLDLNSKMEKLNARMNSISAAKPVHEKLLGTNEDRQKSSMFTEVCVGLILAILVGFILFKVYKSRLYVPGGRSLTSSTRNIAESMESAHL
ncbi:toll-like receptor 13 [Leguminivora glycinivorella]|uniref:toll-like receptor 13 n=1 Tax=Leguminivora glycinivorella TaxID=1035111 RepID=UPI00200C38A0|nr:toll-like receptor 13 [Leguminivora glycinivorella]